MKQLVFPVLAALFAVGLAGLVGGPVDIDISEAQDFLDFAVATHNRASNDMFQSQVSKVIKVQRQVSGCLTSPWTSARGHDGSPVCV